MRYSNEQEREQQSKRKTAPSCSATLNESVKATPAPKRSLCKVREMSFPGCSPLRKKEFNIPRQLHKLKTPAPAQGKFQKRTKGKRQMDQNPNSARWRTKRKKANETSETISGSTLDAFFGLKPDLVQDRKEEIAETASDIHPINLESKATIRVIYGLDQSTAQRFNTKASCSSQECREPLLNCLLNGSVKFQGSSMIDRLDLESLYGGKPREEDNYLTNFVIEAYLQLIATASRSKGLNIETLGWEAFEKGFGNKPMKDLLKGKALLTEQDAVLVPCNPGLSKHWFLLVVLPKEKRVLVLESKAGSFTKPSAENATAKMWKLLQQVDSSLDVKHWCFLTNAPKDIPQQENNIDCGVFLCMFARCLLLQSPAPGSTTINNLRRHMIVELHQQELQSFTEPSVQTNAYYAVEYQKAYYFGRALGSPDGSDFIDFKFLHSTVSSGAKVFDWPRRDDIDRVHSSNVFYGPVTIVGVGPFTLPQLGEVEQVYQWLKKSRKNS